MNSKIPSSNQKTVNRKLNRLISKHLIQPHLHLQNTNHHDQLDDILEKFKGSPVVLDSFCGSAESTHLIASKNPDCLVIGVDKSEVRVNKSKPEIDNLIILCDHIENVWKYLLEHNIHLAYHHINHPNPWPKSKHLQRRFYCHPFFLKLSKLTQNISVRTNWHILALECLVTLNNLDRLNKLIIASNKQLPTSKFEKKYFESNHVIYHLKSELI